MRINTLQTATQDGMCTARAAPHNCIRVSETIDLETYPSCKDFLGEEVICASGQTATIVSYLGRPWRIKNTKQFSEYDIYEILVNDTLCQIFSVNLESIHDTVDE